MTINIPVLVWDQATFEEGRACTLSIDSTVDTTWNIALQGTDKTGDLINAKYAVIDNTGINSTVYIEYGLLRSSVSPYTRKTFQVYKDQNYLRIIVNSGAVPVTFTDFDPGIPDDVNQVATGIAAGGGVSNPATFDTGFTDPGITLSGANLVATSNTAAHYSTSMVQTLRTTGKFYWEIASAAFNNPELGMGNHSMPLNTFGGFDTNSWGVNPSNGNLFYNNAVHGNIGTSGPNGTCGFAVDLTARLLWFRIGAGNWNGSGTADPVAGIGGFDISTFTAGSIGPYASLRTNGDQCTLNTGASPFANPQPTGYGMWNR